jgi:hypothetical protein
MAGEIVLVQPVHDHDDRTAPGVDQPAVEGVSNQPLPACRWVCKSASSGFSGSSMMIMSAPRPVTTPPTEVASQQPGAVVSVGHLIVAVSGPS